MKNTDSSKTSFMIFSAMAAFVALPLTAEATVIVRDEFSRIGSLDGSSPSPTNANAVTWSTQTGTTTDGSALVYSNVINGMMSVSFNSSSLIAGDVVTISCDWVNLSTSTSWLALGFASGNNVFSDTQLWVNINGLDGVEAFGNALSDQFIDRSTTVADGLQHVSISYNLSSLTTVVSVNSSIVGSYTGSSAMNFDRVFLAGNFDEIGLLNSTFDNFRIDVSSAIPETANAGLLAGVSAILFLSLRRSNRRS
jgi:hypothetical protein